MDIDSRIQRLEDRVVETEKLQAAQKSVLDQIEKKIDRVIEMYDQAEKRYVTKESCEQTDDYHTTQLSICQERISSLSSEFKKHIQEHYGSKDRIIAYIQTAALGVIIAKLANLI